MGGGGGGGGGAGEILFFIFIEAHPMGNLGYKQSKKNTKELQHSIK